ncbi:MAG: hypothetical protein GW938_14880 [Leptospira sp.]|nr:hypothetical protein [Leptospira sp.]NCS94194.1 hypothetical protein [Leptospira sp.]
MKKILIILTLAIVLQSIGCAKKKEKTDPALQLLLLQNILNRKDIVFNKMRFLNNKFYGVGSGGQVYSSTDGETWNKKSLGTNQQLFDIGFINNKFTIIGNTVHFNSDDGENWTDISSTFSQTNELIGIGNFASTLVVFGKGFTSLSTNGSTFSLGGSVGNNVFYSDSASNSTRIVLVGNNSTTFTGTVIIGTFVAANLSFSSGGVTGLASSSNLSAIAYNGIRFVTVSLAGKVYYSNDGSVWLLGNSGLPTTIGLNGITYGQNKFIAVGKFGTILSSNDGITWSAISSGTSVDLKSIAFGNGKFVAVGKDTILVSADGGTTWSGK